MTTMNLSGLSNAELSALLAEAQKRGLVQKSTSVVGFYAAPAYVPPKGQPKAMIGFAGSNGQKPKTFSVGFTSELCDHVLSIIQASDDQRKALHKVLDPLFETANADAATATRN